MIQKPKFKSHLRVEVVEPDLVVLLFETGHYVLEGCLHCLLAPQINGKSTVADIMDQLEGQATVLDVLYGLELLAEKGFIVEANRSEERRVGKECRL